MNSEGPWPRAPMLPLNVPSRSKTVGGPPSVVRRTREPSRRAVRSTGIPKIRPSGMAVRPSVVVIRCSITHSPQILPTSISVWAPKGPWNKGPTPRVWRRIKNRTKLPSGTVDAVSGFRGSIGDLAGEVSLASGFRRQGSSCGGRNCRGGGSRMPGVSPLRFLMRPRRSRGKEGKEETPFGGSGMHRSRASVAGEEAKPGIPTHLLRDPAAADLRRIDVPCAETGPPGSPPSSARSGEPFKPLLTRYGTRWGSRDIRSSS